MAVEFSTGTPAGFLDRSLPLCVDMDGTVVKTDTLFEALLRLMNRRPSRLFLIPAWLARGRAFFKQELARHAELNVAQLPYNQALLSYLRQEADLGRRLVLVTGADKSLAEAVAAGLDLFSGVYASDGKVNLVGAEKARFLRGLFGGKGFLYAGNAADDLPVWRLAKGAILVNGGRRFEGRLGGIPILKIADGSRGLASAVVKAIRVHQWPKNILVVAGLLSSHQIFRIEKLVQAALAFAAFSLTASSVYLLNDLLDLGADRGHPERSGRPLANGDLPLEAGLALMPLLLAAGLGLGALLPAGFLDFLLLYCALTTLYSFYLKRLIIADILCLAGLYTLRVLAGGAATGISISNWLLSFSMFLFLSLATVKRVSELMFRAASPESASGRGYQSQDISFLSNLGVVSGCLAALVFALYIESPSVRPLYRQPELLWLICPLLLYWILRVWFITSRRRMSYDPVVFALRDQVSWIIAAAGATVLYWAS
ncbi:MAG: UbiA family prenyltransferase [Elusimicrobia bacterium]|nr:UbiA family prenyltransferase [Elusimicrobiota bacterium]